MSSIGTETESLLVTTYMHHQLLLLVDFISFHINLFVALEQFAETRTFVREEGKVLFCTGQE